MSTDPHARIAAAVRAIADAPPVTPPPPGALRERRARSASRRAAPALAAAAVIAVAAVVALLPARGTTERLRMFADVPAAATLPERFAGMSLLTATVSEAPPGPAIALYSQGSLGSRRLATSQLVVTGVDGRTYRRLDEAKESGWRGSDGEWHGAKSLLSPDGERVAVGSRGIVDLYTGRTTPFAPSLAGVVPVAWSPDGQRLVVARPTASLEESAVGHLLVLDLATGAATPLADAPGPVPTVAFSPDGTRVAVAEEGSVLVAGGVRQRLPLTDRQSLAAGPSWSPDGRLLVLNEIGGSSIRLAFADATLTGQPVPAPVTLRGDGAAEVLGWRTADTMLVGIDDDGGYEIAEVSVHGGPEKIVSRLSHGPGQLARVNGLQLATGLLAHTEVRDVGGADRGPWPTWWRVTVGGLVLLTGLVAWRVVRRRRYAPSTIAEQAVHDDDTRGQS
jgi:DNA-binding beta-propeller fold protein YncE